MFFKSVTSKSFATIALVALLTACNATGVGHALHVALEGFNKGQAANSDNHTLVFLTRHAEKQSDQGRDPNLTEQGSKRAQNLAYALSKSKLSAVYSTNYKRTMQTATPTALEQSLQLTMYEPSSKELAKAIVDKHKGQKVLVVGHSNTTPELLAALGVKEPVVIEHDQYGDLYLVILKDGKFDQMVEFSY